MKIEDVIKQRKPFKNETTKALVNVLYTGNLFQEVGSNALKPFEINEQHYNILRILNGRFPESATPGEVKEVLLSKRGDLTRLLDKLSHKKWVERTFGESDRRQVHIKITSDGRASLKEMEKAMQVLQNYAINLSEDEACVLNSLLDKMRG